MVPSPSYLARTRAELQRVRRYAAQLESILARAGGEKKPGSLKAAIIAILETSPPGKFLRPRDVAAVLAGKGFDRGRYSLVTSVASTMSRLRIAGRAESDGRGRYRVAGRK